jgi:site-specific DNA-methyltransferase (adenine-specific)
VSRPRDKRFLSWGSLPGWYKAPRDASIVRGGKPLGLMRAIVRHYSRPGDLVCDPCAGGGTTLLAAAVERRRAIGSEIDPITHAAAMARIARGFTPDLFSGAA